MKKNKQRKIYKRQAKCWMQVCHLAMDFWPDLFDVDDRPPVELICLKLRQLQGIEVIQTERVVDQLCKELFGDKPEPPMSNARIENLTFMGTQRPHGEDGTCETGDCGPKPDYDPKDVAFKTTPKPSDFWPKVDQELRKKAEYTTTARGESPFANLDRTKWFASLKRDPTTKTQTCDCGAVYNQTWDETTWILHHYPHRQQSDGVRAGLTDVPHVTVDERVEDDVVYSFGKDAVRIEETDNGVEMQRLCDPLRNRGLDWMRSKP